MAATFRDLVNLIGRIEHAMSSAAGFMRDVGIEQRQLGIAAGLRGQIGTATRVPDIVQGLQSAIRQGLGGQATPQIRESIRRYQQFSRQAEVARRREQTESRRGMEATRRHVAAYRQAQQYATIPGLPPNVVQAIQAGTILPHIARMVGGTRFENIATRMHWDRQQATQAGGAAARARQQRMQAARQAAGAASRGQQAALGPQGIPQGGGAMALANIIGRLTGGSGMGGLMGALFGPIGIIAGGAFDLVMRSVTQAFDALDRSVVRATRTIDYLHRWSMGGFQAAVTLTIAEIHKQIYLSRELGSDMMRFARAQRQNIEAWLRADVVMERFNFQMATAFQNMQGWFGRNIVSPFLDLFKEDPARDLALALGPLTGAINALYRLMVGEQEKKDAEKFEPRELTPWEKAMRDMIDQFQKGQFGGQGPGRIQPGQGVWGGVKPPPQFNLNDLLQGVAPGALPPHLRPQQPIPAPGNAPDLPPGMVPLPPGVVPGGGPEQGGGLFGDVIGGIKGAWDVWFGKPPIPAPPPVPGAGGVAAGGVGGGAKGAAVGGAVPAVRPPGGPAGGAGLADPGPIIVLREILDLLRRAFPPVAGVGGGP